MITTVHFKTIMPLDVITAFFKEMKDKNIYRFNDDLSEISYADGGPCSIDANLKDMWNYFLGYWFPKQKNEFKKAGTKSEIRAAWKTYIFMAKANKKEI